MGVLAVGRYLPTGSTRWGLYYLPIHVLVQTTNGGPRFYSVQFHHSGYELPTVGRTVAIQDIYNIDLDK